MQTPSTSKKRSRTIFESPSFSRLEVSFASINAKLFHCLLKIISPDTSRFATALVEQVSSYLNLHASPASTHGQIQLFLHNLHSRVVKTLNDRNTSPALLAALALISSSLKPEIVISSEDLSRLFASLSPTLMNLKQLMVEYNLPSSQFLYLPQPSLSHTIYTVSTPSPAPTLPTSPSFTPPACPPSAVPMVDNTQYPDDGNSLVKTLFPDSVASIPLKTAAPSDSDAKMDVKDGEEPLFASASAASMQSVFDKSKTRATVPDMVIDNLSTSPSVHTGTNNVDYEWESRHYSDKKHVFRSLRNNSPEYRLFSLLQAPSSKYIPSFAILKSATVYARQLQEIDRRLGLVEHDTTSCSSSSSSSFSSTSIFSPLPSSSSSSVPSENVHSGKFPLPISRNFKIPMQPIWEVQVSARSVCSNLNSLVPFAWVCSYLFDRDEDNNRSQSSTSSSLVSTSRPLLPFLLSCLTQLATHADLPAPLWSVQLHDHCTNTRTHAHTHTNTHVSTGSSTGAVSGSPQVDVRVPSVHANVIGSSAGITNDSTGSVAFPRNQWANAQPMHTYTPSSFPPSATSSPPMHSTPVLASRTPNPTPLPAHPLASTTHMSAATASQGMLASAPVSSAHFTTPKSTRATLSGLGEVDLTQCCCISCAKQAWEQFMRDSVPENITELTDFDYSGLMRVFSPLLDSVDWKFRQSWQSKNKKPSECTIYGVNSLLFFRDCAHIVGGDVTDPMVQKKSGRILDLLSSHPEMILATNASLDDHQKIAFSASHDSQSSIGKNKDPQSSVTPSLFSSEASAKDNDTLFSSQASDLTTWRSNPEKTSGNPSIPPKNNLLRWFAPQMKAKHEAKDSTPSAVTDAAANTSITNQHVTSGTVHSHGMSDDMAVNDKTRDSISNEGGNVSVRGKAIYLNATLVDNYEQLLKLLHFANSDKLNWDGLRTFMDEDPKKIFTLVDTDKVEGQTQQLLIDMFQKMLL